MTDLTLINVLDIYNREGIIILSCPIYLFYKEGLFKTIDYVISLFEMKNGIKIFFRFEAYYIKLNF